MQIRKLCLIGIATLIASVAHAQAAEVNLSWTVPNKYTDGTTLAASDVKEYEIQMSTTATGTFTRVGNAVGGVTSTHKLSSAPVGAQCYRILTVLNDGRRSDPSNVACINTSKPNAPTAVTVTVTVTVP